MNFDDGKILVPSKSLLSNLLLKICKGAQPLRRGVLLCPGPKPFCGYRCGPNTPYGIFWVSLHRWHWRRPTTAPAAASAGPHTASGWGPGGGGGAAGGGGGRPPHQPCPQPPARLGQPPEPLGEAERGERPGRGGRRQEGKSPSEPGNSRSGSGLARRAAGLSQRGASPVLPPLEGPSLRPFSPSSAASHRSHLHHDPLPALLRPGAPSAAPPSAVPPLVHLSRLPSAAPPSARTCPVPSTAPRAPFSGFSLFPRRPPGPPSPQPPGCLFLLFTPGRGSPAGLAPGAASRGAGFPPFRRRRSGGPARLAPSESGGEGEGQQAGPASP